jgi:hypothetical protein
MTVDPVTDALGNLTGAVHIASDITDRKRAELTQVRGFDHKILDFWGSIEHKSFGGGSGFGGRRCSEDLLR